MATPLRASTSDLLPTVAAIVGVAAPDRPLDGVDLMPLIAAGTKDRPTPLFFWGYDIPTLTSRKPGPYLDPELQKGTTPLVKKMGGIATRNFDNLKFPGITEADFGGARSIIDGRYKLLIQERQKGEARRELFDLEADPGEKSNLAKEKPEVYDALAAKLRAWQESVLQSLTGADYTN